MQKKHRVVYGIAVTALIAGLGAAAIAYAGDDGPPSSGQVASAQQTSDLMVNELVAALFQEFNETTPQNVAQGKQPISLIFNDHNRDMREEQLRHRRALQRNRHNRPLNGHPPAALCR